ncbi:MAG: hypothetical protein WDA42_03660 [Candidatus Bathyarchaeia archaeon]
MMFSMVASFTGVLNEDFDDGRYRYDCDLDDIVQLCKQHNIPYDITEEGDSEYSYLAEESPEEEWFQHLRDVTIGVFLERKQFKAFVEDLGAYAEDCQTMGTLGGPLGYGVVPDIPMRMKSSQILDSIRVTPCPLVNGEPIHLDTEEKWDRVREAFLEAYGP